jgi:L,D-transpeptidase ErfK/SrfK
MSDLLINENENLEVKKSGFKSFISKPAIKFPLVMVVLILFVLILPFLVQSITTSLTARQFKIISTSSSEEFLAQKTSLEKNISQLENKLIDLTPKSFYFVVNSTDNDFQLYKGKELIREGRCSTGKNELLERKNGKKYLFKTPKGVFTIKLKKTHPVWTKPDWAFIEEGLPVPSPNDPDRFDDATLGDYALALGDGYMIHGTVWQRFLGLPVTHGCIRLDDDDLEFVYNSLQKGSNVYIY